MGLIIKNGVIYNGAESEPMVYSLDEREVGVWIDGKPVYEQTVVGNAISDTGINVLWERTDIDTVVEYNCIFLDDTDLEYNANYYYSTGAYFRVFIDTQSVWTNTKGIVCQRSSNQAINGTRLTIRYTKTTDTPGSGTWTPSGVKSEHYSTNEHVVGTWIDGSTIYEKTLVIEPPFTSDMTITHNITNINRVIEAKSFIDCGNGSSEIFNDPPINGNAFDWIIRINDFTRTNFSIKIGSSRLPYTVGIYITIRYTKLS